MSNSIKPITLLGYNTASCDGTYKVITASLAEACSELHLSNNSDKDMKISLNGGATDHLFVKAGTYYPVNAQALARPFSGLALIEKGTAISIKGEVGTGFFYISGFFQK